VSVTELRKEDDENSVKPILPQPRSSTVSQWDNALRPYSHLVLKHLLLIRSQDDAK